MTGFAWGVPPLAADSSSGSGSRDGASIELALFGEDLFFDDDLQVTSSGDYAIVDGYASLRQAILNRLLTSPGEYAVFPDYGAGLKRWVKKRLNPSEVDALKQIIRDQLAREDRIENITDVSVTRDDIGTNTGLRVAIRAIAIGREQSFAFSIKD